LSARRLIAVAAGALALAPATATAQGTAPRVEAMLVARDGGIVAAGPVRVPAARVGRCRLRAGLAVGVLAALRRLGAPSFRATGSCDALYVSRIGAQGESRLGGWVYKVGRRLPPVSASDPTGRLRSGQRVTWFFCERAGRCQRTLEIRPSARRVAPGAGLRVTVTAYDDRGRGRAASGVVVEFGDGTATTGAGGVATVRAPAARGPQALQARARGLIPAYPVEVTVG